MAAPPRWAAPDVPPPPPADSPVGAYHTSRPGLTSTDYDIHFQNGILTVTAYAGLQGDMLLVGGTPGDDTFTFTPGPTAGSVVVKVDSTTLGTFTPAGGITAYGGAGMDAVVVNGTNAANSFTLELNRVTLNGIPPAIASRAGRSTKRAAATRSRCSAVPPRSTAAAARTG